MLVRCVRSVSQGAEAVQGGGQFAGEIGVGRADETGLLDVQAKASGELLCSPEEGRFRAVATIGGRLNSPSTETVTPGRSDPGERIAWATSTAASLDGARTSTRARAGRDDVGKQAVDGSDADGDPAVGVVQREEPLDLAGKPRIALAPSSGLEPACGI